MNHQIFQVIAQSHTIAYFENINEWNKKVLLHIVIFIFGYGI